MKLLLDTHTFIWWDSEPAKLSVQALALCQNPENTLVIIELIGTEDSICEAYGLFGTPQDEIAILARNAGFGLLFIKYLVPEWEDNSRNELFHNAIKKISSGTEKVKTIVGQRMVTMEHSVFGFSIAISPRAETR